MSKNYDCKHITTTQRIKIEKGLLDGDSFASITRTIGGFTIQLFYYYYDLYLTSVELNKEKGTFSIHHNM